MFGIDTTPPGRPAAAEKDADHNQFSSKGKG